MPTGWTRGSRAPPDSKLHLILAPEPPSSGIEAAVLLKATGGVTMASRATSGGTETNAAGPVVSDPYWVKLVRTGNTFYGYSSPDGMNWTLISSPTIPMTGTVYAGIGTSSGSTSADPRRSAAPA